jgi:CRISPR-associated protein Cmr6
MSESLKSRRQALDKIELKQTVAPHAGLWLDKFLGVQQAQGGEGTRAPHLANVAGIPVGDDYRTFFDAWQRTLQEAGAATRQAKTLGRLAIGLGAESVLETSITLHRTFGVPYIPGSALKGLAARYARRRLQGDEWRKHGDNLGEAYKILFGDTSEAGYVTFFDALYVPGSAPRDRPLDIDVITVHHPLYYRGENAPPADWDSPTPVPFLSARGSYLLALHGEEAWVEAAFQILAYALEEEGIGAKTSSGYGRMAVKNEGSNGQTTSPDATTVQRFKMRLDAMTNQDVAGQIHAVYQEWQDTENISEKARKAIAQLILDKIEAAGRTKKSAKKAWYQELVAFVQQ